MKFKFGDKVKIKNDSFVGGMTGVILNVKNKEEAVTDLETNRTYHKISETEHLYFVKIKKKSIFETYFFDKWFDENDLEQIK